MPGTGICQLLQPTHLIIGNTMICSSSSSGEHDDQHDRKLSSSSLPSSRQKRAVVIAVVALGLAVAVFAVAVSSSLLKKKQSQRPGDRQQHHQIIWNRDDNEHDVSHEDDHLENENEESIGLETNDAATATLTEPSSFTDIVLEGENYDSEKSVENEATTALNTTTLLLPEDCDNPDCILIHNKSKVEEEDEEVSIFQGPISDFIVSTNVSQVVENTDTHPSSSSSGGGGGDDTIISDISRINKCSNSQGLVQIILDTDNYSWETSWKIVRLNTNNNPVVASGPPSGKNYARRTRYTGRLCLPIGRYRLTLNDQMGDGICCTYGKGQMKMIVNGKTVMATKIQGEGEKYKVKNVGFLVKREGNSNNNPQQSPPINNGRECSLVTPVKYNAKFQHGTIYQKFTGFQCYRTVEGTRKTINDLLTKYPQLTRRAMLPNYLTAELGQRLQALVITNKQSNPAARNPKFGQKGKLMIISSIHAREIATGEAVTRFAEYLLQNYGVDPDVTWILDYTEIHIIPHANPDGRKYLERGGEKDFWKKNRNNSMNCNHWRYGVDPNRNFPFKWGRCNDSDGSQRCSSSGDCQSVVYRGPRAQSEQETKAILQYALSEFPARQRKGNLQKSEADFNAPFGEDSEGVFLDVHSYGRDVGWPWGFVNQKTPNDNALGALGRKLASFSGYSLWAPKMPNRLYGFDGSTIDTMYGWLGVASFFFELGTSFYEPCETFPTVIREVFPAFLYAAKVAKEPYRASRGPDILCTTISSINNNDGKYIRAIIQVSDSNRASHADDDGSLFSTGRQNIKSVEIFVNCHPYSGCNPAVRKNLSNADRTATVTLQFKAPVNRRNNVMYIRATDSQQYTGPVSARSFVS